MDIFSKAISKIHLYAPDSFKLTEKSLIFEDSYFVFGLT